MAYEDFDDEDDFDPSYGIGELEEAPIEFPADVGECIDKLFMLRSQRIMLGKEIAERKRTEAKYTLHIIGKLRDAKLSGGMGSKANASYKIEKVPTATKEGWPKIWKYIKEHDAFDLLAKKLSGKAVKERWEAGEIIEGIETFDKPKLSLTKRS